MKTIANQEKARSIIEYYKLHNCDRRRTIYHFVDQGVSVRTIQRVLKRFRDEGRIDFVMSGGRPRSVLNEINLKKIKRQFVKDPSTSVRKISQKLDIPKSTVQSAKSDIGIKTKKKRKAPNYVNDQAERCKRNALKLYKKSLETHHQQIFVLDDETYVPADPSQVAGSHFYNEVEGVELEEHHKIIPKTKFPKRYLVWQAIASNGALSEPFITTGTVNGEVYRKECLKRLIKFIDTLGDRNRVLFWPDMATAHYEKTVTAALEQAKINYVKKGDNTPNCPQIRPIERYWALCKAKYKQLTTISQSKNSFTRRWKKISAEVSRNSGQNLFSSFTSKLYKVGRFGVHSVK